MRILYAAPVLMAALAVNGSAAARAQCPDPTLAGRVTADAAPVEGADVVAYWLAPDSTRAEIRLTTDGTGRFRYCGRLPASRFLLRAHLRDRTSAPVRLGPPGDAPLRADLALDRRSVPFLPGYITNASSGKPVEGALVRVREADGWALSAKDGSFALHDVEIGRRTLVVSHISFGALAHDFLVGASENQLVDVRVDPKPLVLEPLTVTVARRFTTPGMAAFYDRMEKGTGYFVDREDIQRTSPSSMLDLVRGIPGIRYYCERGECALMVNRAAACDMMLFVDGSPWDIRALQVFDPRDVEGVEVYLHVGQIPSRYRGAGAECGIVGIWLRPRRP